MPKKAIASDSGAQTPAQASSLQSEVPLYDQQNSKWYYQGHEVRSFNANEMYDSVTGYILAAPLKDAADFANPVVDPADFKEYAKYTFEDPLLEYSDMDVPLLPQAKANPLYWPTPETVMAIAQILVARYPNLTVIHGKAPYPVTTFTSDLGTCQNTDGLIAHDIQMYSVDAAMARLNASLVEAGVVKA